MSETTDTTDSKPEYRVAKDYSDRDTASGVENTRTIIMEVPALGNKTYGAKATFSWDDDEETYYLAEYRRQKYKGTIGWDGRCTAFTPKDVGYLERITDHLQDATRGGCEVVLFHDDD